MNSFHFLLARGENENTRNGLIKTRVAATFERVSPSVLETRRGDGIRRIETQREPERGGRKMSGIHAIAGTATLRRQL